MFPRNFISLGNIVYTLSLKTIFSLLQQQLPFLVTSFFYKLSFILAIKYKKILLERFMPKIHFQKKKQLKDTILCFFKTYWTLERPGNLFGAFFHHHTTWSWFTSRVLPFFLVFLENFAYLSLILNFWLHQIPCKMID